MKWLDSLRFWSVRIPLLLTFLSYYFLMVLTNFDKVEAYANPLQPFKGSVYFIDKHIYAGPYPDPEALAQLQDSHGVRRVVSVLNPEVPFVRELAQSEAEACRRLGMEYIALPEADARELAGVLASAKVRTYVHRYFMTSDFKSFVKEAASK
ncbi:hypothetical protein WCX18_07315 [Sulfurimonas sp. HSL1-2]|uniref:hypothetical protein n=1 Tax=Thiomicrolovo zhangzhouensis TaxID=3131933 RepID=UPI0031F87C72